MNGTDFNDIEIYNTGKNYHKQFKFVSFGRD